MTTEPRCDRIVGPDDDLRAILDEVADGAVVGLPAGTWTGPGMIGRSVTLVSLAGSGETTIDGQRQGPVVHVQADGLTVKLIGLVLRNGFAETGGGVRLDGFSELHVQDCMLRDNKAGQGGGGGAHADAGDLILTRCRLFDNTGKGGNTLLIDGVAGARVDTCLLVGDDSASSSAMRVGDGAEVTVHGSTVVAEGGGAALQVSGTASRRPTVKVHGSLLSGSPAMDLSATHAGRVHVSESLLSSPAQGVYKPAGKVLVDAPWFERDGAEPYRPGRPSMAHGLVARGEGDDLVGRPRPAAGATAGAFQ